VVVVVYNAVHAVILSPFKRVGCFPGIRRPAAPAHLGEPKAVLHSGVQGDVCELYRTRGSFFFSFLLFVFVFVFIFFSS
jgi:hypothetical protein